MNFDEFRKDLELKLNSLSLIELQEFQFQAHAFGSGTVAYRINGCIHKYVFDGRENVLTWYKSGPHEKYSNAKFSEIMKLEELNIKIEDLKNEILEHGKG